jgi:hypothetical protein
MVGSIPQKPMVKMCELSLKVVWREVDLLIDEVDGCYCRAPGRT